MNYLIAVVISLCLLPIQVSYAKLDEKNGFRDATFGADVRSFKNLALIKESSTEHYKWYSRSSDKLSIGEYPITSIQYIFHDGRLLDITIHFAGYNTSVGITRILETTYGKGKVTSYLIDSKNRKQPEIYWKGNKVTMNISPSTSYNKYEYGTLKLSSIEVRRISDKRESLEKKSRLIRASKDL